MGANRSPAKRLSGKHKEINGRCLAVLCVLHLSHGKTRELGGLPSFNGGANPPDERKEGVANDYIF